MGLLLEETVDVPLALEEEPAGSKQVLWIASPRLPALEICDEADPLCLQEAERIAAVAAPIEDERERPRPMSATDLFHRAGDSASQGGVEGLGKKEGGGPS